MWRTLKDITATDSEPGLRVHVLEGDDRQIIVSALLRTHNYLPGDSSPQLDSTVPLTDKELGKALIAMGTRLLGLQLQPAET